MAFYRTCPYCGCSLDPGEICDCREREAEREADLARLLAVNPKTGQMEIRMKPVKEGLRNVCV